MNLKPILQYVNMQGTCCVIYLNVTDIPVTIFSFKFVNVFMVTLCQGEHK